jgi:hypothetical protein
VPLFDVLVARPGILWGRIVQLLFAKAGEGYNAALPGHIGRDLILGKL